MSTLMKSSDSDMDYMVHEDAIDDILKNRLTVIKNINIEIKQLKREMWTEIYYMGKNFFEECQPFFQKCAEIEIDWKAAAIEIQLKKWNGVYDLGYFIRTQVVPDAILNNTGDKVDETEETTNDNEKKVKRVTKKNLKKQKAMIKAKRIIKQTAIKKMMMEGYKRKPKNGAKEVMIGGKKIKLELIQNLEGLDEEEKEEEEDEEQKEEDEEEKEEKEDNEEEHEEEEQEEEGEEDTDDEVEESDENEENEYNEYNKDDDEIEEIEESEQEIEEESENSNVEEEDTDDDE